MNWACSWNEERNDAYKDLGEEICTIERLTRRWEDNINIGLAEIGRKGMMWLELI
jgi:hypothetical protein